MTRPEDMGPQVKDEAALEVGAAEELVEVEASSDEGTSDSTSESDEGQSDCEMSRPAKRVCTEMPSESIVWYMHRGSRKLHMLKGQEDRGVLDKSFNCGRPWSDAYTRAGSADMTNAKCVMCTRTPSRP